MHLRVTSSGKLKQCIQSDENDIKYLDGNIRNNILTALSQPVNFDIKPARYIDTKSI